MECWVYTYKEGLLSPVAHDLKIRVSRFSIDVDGDIAGAADGVRSVAAVFDSRSLQTRCAVADIREAHGKLSKRDLRKIDKSIAKDVLRADRYPEISFRSTAIADDGLTGKLTLCGVTRTIDVRVRRDADGLVAQAEIHQPDFGIKPFTALLGTLRIKPDVRVEILVG